MLTSFYHAMLCICSTSHGPVSLCVCLSVTSWCSTKTAVRRITHTMSQDSTGILVFWRQRSPRNLTGVTLYEGAKCRWGRSKSATWQITGCISKTVQDRCSFFFSFIVEYEVVCTLSNGGIAHDLECPISTPKLPQFVHFAPPFIASQRVNLETSVLVASPTLPMKNLPWKGRGQCQVTHFRILHLNIISPQRLTLETWNSVQQVVGIQVISTTHP